jgi:hypothetical protein
MENIKILGDNFNSLPDEIYINNSSVPPAKLVSLTKEGENVIILKWNSKLTNCDHMFDGCTYLLSIDLSHFESSIINRVEYMFNNCQRVKFINLTNFNPPYVSSLFDFMHNCYALTSIDMTNCNIPSTNYNNAFIENSALIYFDLSNFKPTNLQKISFFLHNSFNLILLDISNLITTSVTSKNCVFSNCNFNWFQTR